MFRLALPLAFVVFVAGAFSAAAQDDIYTQIGNLPWQRYPAVGQIGNVAEIQLANELAFLGEDATMTFLSLNGNPKVDDTYTIAPSDMAWFAVFGFEETGYIKDDEKIDADSLLKTLKEENIQSQAERKKSQLPVLVLDDWAITPHYDIATKRLEWGTLLHDAETDEIVANYTARILGRSGVMHATLVSSAETLEHDVESFHSALEGFSFESGQRYAEYKQGDKLAEYGLVALIAG